MKITRILIGIDDGPFAEHAAEYAFDIAQQFKAEVGLVNIIEPVIFPATTSDNLTGLPTYTSPINEVELYDAQNEMSDGIIERITKKFAGELQVSHYTEFGSTAEGIINCSKEFKADLIVIGTHSRSGIDRLLMGSVAEHVVRYSEVPVLVIPSKEFKSQ